MYTHTIEMQYHNVYNTKPAMKQSRPCDTSLRMSEANFPSLAPEKIKDQKEKENITMNFKKVAESVKDKPDPALIVKPISTTITSSEPKEIYDLSAYVALQEKRQKEYDYLYGEGSFVNDRLKYDRFESASEHSDSSEEEEDETDLMDY